MLRTATQYHTYASLRRRPATPPKYGHCFTRPLHDDAGRHATLAPATSAHAYADAMSYLSARQMGRASQTRDGATPYVNAAATRQPAATLMINTMSRH